MSGTATLEKAHPGMGARIRVKKLPKTQEGVRLLERLLGRQPAVQRSYEVTIDETTFEPLKKLTQRAQGSRKLVIINELTSHYIVVVGSTLQSKSRTGTAPNVNRDREMPTAAETSRIAQSITSHFGERATQHSNYEPASPNTSGETGDGRIVVRPLEKLGIVIVSGDVRLDEIDRLGIGRIVPSSSLRFEFPQILMSNRKLQESWHLVRLNALGFGRASRSTSVEPVQDAKSPVWIGFVDSGLDPDVAARIQGQDSSLREVSRRGRPGIRRTRRDSYRRTRD